jgi:tetratricopeptide (TPR) repeat protein
VAAGRCLGRSGRFREAIELLDGARTAFPAVLEVPAMLARTFLLQTESDRGMLHPEIAWADAAGLAEEVLQREPNHEDSRMVLAQARYLLGDHDEAVRQAEEAARRHPQHPGAHVLLGRIATDRFRTLLQRYERERPDGQVAADQVAAIDVQRRAARSAYQRAVELDSSRPHPHVALAQLALLDHRDELARKHLVDAMVADPEVAIDHGVVERGLDWRGRVDVYTEALRRYEATPQHQPKKAAALRWYLGRAHYDGAQWEPAQKLFTQALVDDPAAKNCLYYLAFAAYHAGDHDTAERHAAAYAALGAPAFADEVRRLDGELRGQTGAIVQYLADRAFQQGRREPSRDLNHVIACLKDSADAWNNHAFLCRETGRFDDALASYQHAIEKEPDSPQLWNDHGAVLQYHVPTPENRAKARTMYEKAIRLADAVLADPKAPTERRERAQRARQDATANLAALE